MADEFGNGVIYIVSGLKTFAEGGRTAVAAGRSSPLLAFERPSR